MEKQSNEYVDLMPKQEELEEFSTGFEIDFKDTDKGLEGIPTMDLEIGLTNF